MEDRPVIVVAQHPLMGKVYADINTKAGFTSVSVSRPEDAIPHLSSGRASLLLVDLDDLAGDPASRAWACALQAIATETGVPILACATPSIVDREDILLRMPQQFLPKPFRVHELITALHSLLLPASA